MLELARTQDREAVERLARQIHRLHISWRPDLYEDAELFPRERFDACIRDRELYTARLNGTVVGYALVKIRRTELPGQVCRKVMLIDQICVEEELRGHGLGTQILSDIHALAGAFGCTDLQLGVYPQNDAAVAFYQKCGFMIQSINMQKKL